jgi:hypothetical protein
MRIRLVQLAVPDSLTPLSLMACIGDNSAAWFNSVLAST